MTPTPKDLESQLRAFIANRSNDPAVDPLVARATALEGQRETAKARHASAQQSADDASLAVERAYVKGSTSTSDATARRKLRATAAELADDVEVLDRALDQVRRDIATATAAKVDRDVATLRPIFASLAAIAEQQAEALTQTMDVFQVAHQIAIDVLPASHDLQQGFAGLLSRDRVERWRDRATTAGLLTQNRQRVA